MGPDMFNAVKTLKHTSTTCLVGMLIQPGAVDFSKVVTPWKWLETPSQNHACVQCVLILQIC